MCLKNEWSTYRRPSSRRARFQRSGGIGRWMQMASTTSTTTTLEIKTNCMEGLLSIESEIEVRIGSEKMAS